MSTQPSTHPSYRKVSATVYRVADYDTPLWARPNLEAGRWNSAAEHPTQYWSFSPDTVWAERLRADGITEPDDVVEIRSKIWAAHFELDEVADLTAPAWRKWLSLAPNDLTDDDHAACRAAATKLREIGAQGLITPSAALPNRKNLVVFGPRVHGEWHESDDGTCLPLRIPQFVPVQLIANGFPDPEIAASVRHRAA